MRLVKHSSTVVLAVALIVGPSPVFSQYQSEAKTSVANNSDGLQLLLHKLLLTAEGNDQPTLRSLIESMEIPNYEEWFVQVLGEQRGRDSAATYRKSLRASEQQFEMLWLELAKQQGQISVERLQSARNEPVVRSLDEYRATWAKTDDSSGPDSQPIGTFYYVDGKFRYDGTRHEIRVLSKSKTGAIKLGRIVQRVQPAYPTAAQQLKIHGIVAVNVIVQKDGTVTVQNVGGGHPLLVPAAVEAVKQWRYEPTTVDGEPVEYQTKLYVIFAAGDRSQ
jgi:TonB family protein